MSIIIYVKRKNFLIAVQYYRAPTPLPDEWEEDIENIRKLGFEAIQLRIQWRWNERKEGIYNFSDIDRLFDIAERNGLGVIIKFMLETAPEYIFRRYSGYRVSPSGEIIYPAANGAYYVGGWLPCFDNPCVREKGSLFIREVVNRYRDRKGLILYNAWNEPRSRPVGECACEHSKRSYQNWLKAKFGTIEEMNRKYGKAWGEFGDVIPPSDTKDYAEMYLWRQWAAYSVKERVRWVVDEIKKLDPERDVMCHVGMCLPVQDVLNDTSDDVLNAETVDIYGTSLPFGSGEFFHGDKDSDIATFNNRDRRHFYMVNLIPDWLRGVKKEFFSYEIYANSLHYWFPDLTHKDIKFYIYSQIAAGAKGICFWQYKAERFGNESICSGLVNIDGSPTVRSREVGKIIKKIKAERDILENYEVEKGPLAVVYDFRADILSRLEHTTEDNRKKGMVHYIYKRAFKGIYRGFFMVNIPPDLIDIRNLKKTLDTHFYPFIYLPSPLVISREEAEVLKGYVDAGGTLISENCLGFREENTWVRAHSFPYGLGDVFGIDEDVPKRLKKKIYMDSLTFDVDDVISSFRPAGAEVLARWEDGGASVTVNRYGKGKAVAVGFHPGLMENTDEFLKVLCKDISLLPEVETRGMVIIKKGRSGDKKVYFLFNYEDRKQKVSLNGMEIEIDGQDVKQVVLKEEKAVHMGKLIAERR